MILLYHAHVCNFFANIGGFENFFHFKSPFLQCLAIFSCPGYFPLRILSCLSFFCSVFMSLLYHPHVCKFFANIGKDEIFFYFSFRYAGMISVLLPFFCKAVLCFFDCILPYPYLQKLCKYGRNRCILRFAQKVPALVIKNSQIGYGRVS